MAHEVETMAYSGQVPWHGLGNVVDPHSSIETMLDAAGLNWRVDLRPVFAEAKDGTKVKLPIKRALMRDSDNKVFGITGDFWKPLQNKDALEFFRDYTESGGASLEVAGSLRGGKLIWALASINKGFKVKGRSHDQVKGYILLSSPHEVGKAIKVRTTATRVVCANTFALAERDAVQYQQSHTKRFDVLAARESIQLAQDQIGAMEASANKLANLKVSEFDKLRVLAESFQPTPEGEKKDAWINKLMTSPNDRSNVLELVLTSVEKAPGAEPDTAWGIFNGVTHFMDHVAGKDNAARLANAWFGDRAKTKIEVFNQLLEMAG